MLKSLKSPSGLNFYERLNNYSDLQRKSRYEVKFPTIPKCLSTKEACRLMNLQDLSLRCEAIDLPGRTFSTFPHRTYGPFIEYPMQSSFPDIQLIFLCSSNMRNKKLSGMQEKVTFENWMNFINPYPAEPFNTGSRIQNVYHNFKYRANYVCDIEVTCYDTKPKNDKDMGDEESFKMTFVGAYPKMIGEVSMTWASEEVARLPVIFTYEYFKYTNMCECDTPPAVVECATSAGQIRRTDTTAIPTIQRDSVTDIPIGQ